MILAIDMGNSNIVIGGIDKSKIYFLERVTTTLNKTDLEYAVNIKNILDIHGIDSSLIEGAILSSVVPPLNKAIISAVKKSVKLDCMLVNPNMETGIDLLMDSPSSVGSDLIVDSVAAVHEYKLPLAVIDMGTATTIFVVDEEKNFIGGIIHPGIRVSLESLSRNTAQLPAIDLDAPSNIISKNTIDSMKNGILYGHAGMIDHCIDKMEEEIGKNLTVIATGGFSSYLKPLCKHELILDDNLLLKGLRILYELNKNGSL